MAGLKSINQPVNLKFPKRSFGKKNPELRSFNPTWFNQYAWLHYDEAKDLALCFTCMVAAKEGKIFNSKADGSFISTGFCNWNFRRMPLLNSGNIKIPTAIKKPWREK